MCIVHHDTMSGKKNVDSAYIAQSSHKNPKNNKKTSKITQN